MQSVAFNTKVEFEPHSWQGVLDTTLCDKVCQWLATGRWFSQGTSFSSTNKTDRHDITEILLKSVLNTINQLNQLQDKYHSVQWINYKESNWKNYIVMLSLPPHLIRGRIWVSDWLLFNIKWAIYQPYHGENK
jgi:hypothetical protein